MTTDALFGSDEEEEEGEVDVEEEEVRGSGVTARAGMGGGAEPTSKLRERLRVSDELASPSAYLDVAGASGVMSNLGVLELRIVEEVPTAGGKFFEGRFASATALEVLALGDNGGGGPWLLLKGLLGMEGGRGGAAEC